MSSHCASDPFKDYNYNNHVPREDILAAVRDAVTVKSSPQDRTRSSKTHYTQATENVTPKQRRSHSTDSPPVVPDKTYKPSRPKPTKKASMHADAIDRLDISGVGFAMLHHDGPFDACAPSRNKHRHQAPMLAWSPPSGAPPDLTAIPDLSDRHSPVTPPSLNSPYAMVHSGTTGLYPSYASIPSSLPKKRVDALAEAWGVAEPEPFEEFSAGGGDRSAPNSISNGKESSSARRVNEAYRDIRDSNHPHRSRSTIPPPQPISLPGSRPINSGPLSPNDGQHPPYYVQYDDGGRANSPRRSKSLIARIKKMRDAPNVPVSYDEGDGVESKDNPEMISSDVDPAGSSSQSRPTHKHQTSFLGLFKTGGGGSTPVSPTYPAEDYSHIEELKDKNLSSTPGDYFGEARRPGTSPGLGRKTSLMRKINLKGVRNRNNSKS